jgi:long-chain acyl-CoA synthetase
VTVVFSIQETEVEVLVTSHELLPKFRKILSTAKAADKLRIIIYMENPIQRTDTSGYRQRASTRAFPSVLLYVSVKTDVL